MLVKLNENYPLVIFVSLMTQLVACGSDSIKINDKNGESAASVEVSTIQQPDIGSLKGQKDPEKYDQEECWKNVTSGLMVKLTFRNHIPGKANDAITLIDDVKTGKGKTGLEKALEKLQLAPICSQLLIESRPMLYRPPTPDEMSFYPLHEYEGMIERFRAIQTDRRFRTSDGITDEEPWPPRKDWPKEIRESHSDSKN